MFDTISPSGPTLRWTGSKWRLAKWICAHLPPHEVYLEPFFGSGAVLFTKRPATLETINDLDGEVVNLFRIIREQPEELARLIELTPWAREEYELCRAGVGLGGVEQARRFLVKHWQSIGRNAGDNSVWRVTRRMPEFGHGLPATYSRWLRLPGQILATANRLRHVQIECRPAIEVIARSHSKHTLIYADPPYLADTCDARDLYAVTMADADHAALLNALDAHPGPVVLSGYAHPLYDDRLRHWTRRDHMALANAGQIRRESLWLNPVAASRMAQPALIGMEQG